LRRAAVIRTPAHAPSRRPRALRAAAIRRLGLLGLLALAGCGVVVDEKPVATPIHLDPKRYGPPQAVPGGESPAVAPRPSPEPVSAAVARRLDAGTVGVMDIEGRVGIRPPQLETAKDGTVEKLSWSRWGADGAQGTGEFALLECKPSCATSQRTRVPAKITLSEVRRCPDGRRYFGSAAVSITSGEPPASYVRAPC